MGYCNETENEFIKYNQCFVNASIVNIYKLLDTEKYMNFDKDKEEIYFFTSKDVEYGFLLKYDKEKKEFLGKEVLAHKSFFNNNNVFEKDNLSDLSDKTINDLDDIIKLVNLSLNYAKRD